MEVETYLILDSNSFWRNPFSTLMIIGRKSKLNVGMVSHGSADVQIMMSYINV